MAVRLVKPKMSRGEEYVVTKVLTNAQVKALTTAINILPAPGSGWAIVVLRGFWKASSGTAWTESADNPVIEYTGGTDIMVIESTGFLDQSTAQVRTQAIAATVTTPVANEGIQIFNPNDELAGGTAAKTLTIQLVYRIMKAS